MKELREVEEAGEGAAARLSAEDEGETAMVKVRVSKVKSEGALREDVLNRVRGEGVI